MDRQVFITPPSPLYDCPERIAVNVVYAFPLIQNSSNRDCHGKLLAFFGKRRTMSICPKKPVRYSVAGPCHCSISFLCHSEIRFRKWPYDAFGQSSVSGCQIIGLAGEQVISGLLNIGSFPGCFGIQLQQEFQRTDIFFKVSHRRKPIRLRTRIRGLDFRSKILPLRTQGGLVAVLGESTPRH